MVIMSVEKRRRQLTGLPYLLYGKALAEPTHIIVDELLALAPIHTITP